MNSELNFFEKLFLRIKSTIKDKNDMEEINEKVILIAVALYFDKKVTVLEENVAKEILDNVFDSDTTFIYLLIKEKIEAYKKEFWVFKKDSEYILKKVLVDGNWHYAEYMLEIFEADGITDDENKILNQLQNLINARKILMKELGLES